MSKPVKLDADADELLCVRLVKTLPAPRQRVFEAWTSAEMIKRWWGPEGYNGLTADSDPRPGGSFQVEIEGPDGTVHLMSGVFTEVIEPSLVCLEIRHRQFEGAAERPEGYIPTQMRIELRDHADGTELTLLHTGFLEAALANRFNGGWTSSLEKLSTLISQERSHA